MKQPSHTVALQSHEPPKTVLGKYSNKIVAGITAALLSVTSFAFTLPAGAVAPECTTANGIDATFISDPTFYVNSTEGFNANYIGYAITPTTEVKNLWVSLTGFNGDNITLAPTQPSYQSSGHVAANDTVYSYFLAQSAEPTTVSQVHNITVYEGNPDVAGSTPLCTSSASFGSVEDTITASSNTVSNISVATTGTSIGSTATVTVTGDTGLIGSGPAYDPGLLQLSPAAKSSFPAGAWRLVDVSMDIVDTSTNYSNMLAINALDGTSSQYTATYTFKAVGTSTAAAEIAPIQYIASGTQVKNTNLSGSVTLPTLAAVDNQLTVAKTASVSTLPASGGTVEYTVTVTNAGTNPATIDEVSDILPVGDSYSTGTAKIDDVTVADPLINPSGPTDSLTFVGPITIPASGSKTFKYTLTLPGTPGEYINDAVAYVGATMIDTTISTGTNTPAKATVTVPSAPPTVTGDTQSTTGTTPVTLSPTVGGGYNAPTQDCVIDPTDTVCKTTVVTPSGTWNVDGATNDVTFTPALGFTGAATITYQGEDIFEQTGTATLTVNVSAPTAPTASVETASGVGTTPVTVSPTTTGTGVDATDNCIVSGPTCVTSLITSEGTWNVEANGDITFTPVDGFEGTAAARTYRVVDAYGQTAENTITITVTAPAAPTIQDQTKTGQKNSNISILPVVTGDSLTFCIVDPATSTCGASLTKTGEGTWVIDGTTGEITFSTAPEYTGSSTVDVKTTDSYGQSATGTFTVTIVSQTPPTLVMDASHQTGFNSQTTFRPTSATAGDGDIASFCLVVSGSCVTTTTTAEGSWSVNDTSGTITFTPATDYTGTTGTMTLRVIDTNNLTDDVDFTVTVLTQAESGSVPVVNDFTMSTIVDTSVMKTPTVTGNDVDWTSACILPAGSANCVRGITVTEGTWTVNPETGTVTFTPASGWTGTVTGTYRIANSLGTTDTATVTVVVTTTAQEATIEGVVWFDRNKNGVLDEGEPLLPNIQVSAVDIIDPGMVTPAGGNLAVSAASSAMATTDANGAYVLTVTPGDYTVTASLSSSKLVAFYDPDGVGDWTTTVTASTGTPADVNFAAAGNGSMSGVIKFSGGETPIPNASVACIWEGVDGVPGTADDITYTTVANGSGVFTYTDIPGGTFSCAGVDTVSGLTSETANVVVDGSGASVANADLTVLVSSGGGNNNGGTGGPGNPSVTGDGSTTTAAALAYTGFDLAKFLAISAGIFAAGAVIFRFGWSPRRPKKTN